MQLGGGEGGRNGETRAEQASVGLVWPGQVRVGRSGKVGYQSLFKKTKKKQPGWRTSDDWGTGDEDEERERAWVEIIKNTHTHTVLHCTVRPSTVIPS